MYIHEPFDSLKAKPYDLTGALGTGSRILTECIAAASIASLTRIRGSSYFFETEHSRLTMYTTISCNNANTQMRLILYDSLDYSRKSGYKALEIIIDVLWLQDLLR